MFRFALLNFLVILVTVTSVCDGDYFTSMYKMKGLAKCELRVVETIKRYTANHTLELNKIKR